jgi:hypothetical protein
MIDAVVNTQTGPCLVHDEPDLEGANALVLRVGGRCAIVRMDGTRKDMARDLDADMAGAFGSVDACPLIRLDGTRVASMALIRIALEN